jgi:hypothetical protein
VAVQVSTSVPSATVPASLSSRYEVRNGRFVLVTQTKKGSVVVPLTNFTATIDLEVTFDDDLQTHRAFELTGTTVPVHRPFADGNGHSEYPR